jgi:hypothetical protein
MNCDCRSKVALFVNIYICTALFVILMSFGAPLVHGVRLGGRAKTYFHLVSHLL